MVSFPAGGDLEVALARLDDGTVAAFEDLCTHEDCPLSTGELEGDRVVCLCHDSAFELATGAPVRGPADEPIRIFETRVGDGALEVLLPDGA